MKGTLKRVVLAAVMTMLLIALQFTWFGLMISGCGEGTDQLLAQSDNSIAIVVPCHVTTTRYPTSTADMLHVYNGRSFYADGNHLGHDIQLDEGTDVHPIGCGIVRFYGAATGYGALVAVIEHSLETPITVVNGMGESVTVTSFLTIFGHLRMSRDREGLDGPVSYSVGQTVNPDDVIGYVNDDAHNGDGAEHLHFGVRLQSASEAKAKDSKWFRGYDGSPSQRKWFADPMLFLATLTSEHPASLWHPSGTALAAPDGSSWMVGPNGSRQKIAPDTMEQEKLVGRVVSSSVAEMSCLDDMGPYTSPRAGHAVIKFADVSTVYEVTGFAPGALRWSFISYEAFRSWGWSDAEIVPRPASERPAFLAQTADQGFRTLRDGSLVKGDGGSEVAVVSEGVRLPVFDWDTFLALGYAPENIMVVPQSTVEQVSGPKGAVITPELLQVCGHPATCLTDCPPGMSGGGWGEGGSPGWETSSSSVTSGSASASSSSSTSSSSSSSSGSVSSSSGSASSSSSGSGGAGGGATGVPTGLVLFQYEGPLLTGTNQLQGMWDPPGPTFYDWTASTFALCPDTIANDGKLECLLDMPSGTEDFLFTVLLPDGSWWGDTSYDPQGGKGSTIGTVTLTGPAGTIPYNLVTNGSGPLYMNGYVPLIP